MFTKKIDKRSIAAMTNFLKNHFRYYTMNSWNIMTSYANKVKLRNLQLPPELDNIAYAFIEAECPEYDCEIDAIRQEFYDKTGYTIGFNGRSSGYIVLYDTIQRDDGTVCAAAHDMDQYEDFSDWTIEMLKERVKLVQEFDKCCDRIRDTFIYYLQNTEIEPVERIYTETHAVAKLRSKNE